MVFGGCCHGDDEKQVFAELCEIIDEWIEILDKDGIPLPPPTAGFHYPGNALRDAMMAIEPDTAPV